MKKLAKKNIEDMFTLTPLQQGILFHYLKNPDSDVYFEQLILEISGPLTIDLFEAAWKIVTASNEMLRTVFQWEQMGNQLQVVLKEYHPEPVVYDLSAGTPGEWKTRLEEIKTADKKNKFDLHQVPFRVTLCKLRDDRYEMIISHHHILFDGWSTGIILKEFFKTYDRLYHQIKPAAPVKTKFKEFVKWVHRQDPAEEKRFWENYFIGYEAPAVLPIKKAGPANKVKGITGLGNLNLVVPGDTQESLERLIRRYKLTMASVLYSAWGILLQKYTDTSDTVFGITLSLRSAKIKGIEDIVGLLINTVPLRFQTGTAGTGETILHTLRRINETLPVLEAHGSTSLVKTREYSGLGHYEELFDTLVVLENYPLDSGLTQGTDSLTIGAYTIFEMTNYDLAVGISLSGKIEIRFIYNSEVFEERSMQGLAGHLARILQEIAGDPEKSLSEIELLSEAEKRKLIIEFNSLDPGYPVEKTIPQLFAEQVDRTPDHIALVDKIHIIATGTMERNVGFSYRELHRLTHGQANRLLEQGVAAGDIVGIMVERSAEMILGILGILKTGAAYLPLNPKNPPERTRYMMKDSGAKILVTGNLTEEGEKVGRWEGEKILLEEISSSTLTSTLTCQVGSANLAYVIYTSGSTGNPKGVPITHANLSPLLHWGYDHLGLGSMDRAAQNLSYYFDWSVWEIFITLTSGASLYMVSGQILLDSQRYVEFLRRHRITVLHITPTHFRSLTHRGERLSTLRHLCIGAEKLTADLVERSYELVEPGCRVYNMYGPTEATIMAAVLEIDPANLPYYKELSSVPIGKTLGNTVLLVLDRYLKPCPLEVTGELYIAGDGLAAGYLNNPELTAEKFIVPSATRGSFEKPPLDPAKLLFIHHSLLTNQYLPEGRLHLTLNTQHLTLYRTGDLARWLPEGTIEFLGRRDLQVKIRGLRIELGEIERCLTGHEAVREAVVTANEYKNGEKYLCAYVVPRSGCSAIAPAVLKAYLSARLPDYMVPSYFITLEQVPLNPNGKVDLKALPGPVFVSQREYVPPRGPIENALAEIWAGVLGIEKERIGIDEDFFQMGGHSLNATALVGQVHKAFSVEIPLAELFRKPTVRAISQYIRRGETRGYAAIQPVEKREYYALSAGQVRFFILQGMDMQEVTYNIPAVMELEGEIDTGRMQEVFKRLIRRHESFRTSFETIAENPVQVIHDEVDFEIENERSLVNGHWSLVKCQGRGEVPSPLTKVFGSPEPFFQKGFWPPEAIIKAFIRPFDLSKAPLLRVGLSSHPPGNPPTPAASREGIRNILMVDIHHIISDGISMKILIDEFMDLYAGKELNPLKLQYKDFSAWQDTPSRKKSLEQQEAYWLKELAGELPVLDLPMDFVRPVVQGFAGRTWEFEIGAGETQELKRLAIVGDSTLYMVLMSLFTVLLSKLGGQEEIVVGSPAAGRRHPELGNIIGLFINTLALRYYPRGEKSFIDFLKELKTQTLEALENQDYPFEKLVEKLAVHRDTSRNPLFDVMLVLQNLDLAEINIPGLNLKPYPFESQIAKFDLTFICTEAGESLKIAIEYGTQLFKPESIEKFARYFRKLVSEVIVNHAGRIGELEIISEEEKQEILCKFNNFESKYESPRTIPGLFGEQVEQTPDRVALVGPKLQLSYGLLNEESHRLAYTLQEKGVKPGSLVGIIMERSVDMIIGILGILNAGSGYVPLNPKAPHTRNQYILDECRVKLLLTAGNLQGVPGWTGETIFTDRLETGTGMDETRLNEAQPSDLAYVIFTSGSTGQPKGVPIRHDNFSPLLHWGYRHLGIGPGERAVQNLSYYFDWSVWEIFIALTRGASLYTVSEELALDVGAYIDFIEKHGITILHITPTQYGYLANTDRQTPTLRYLFIGAEKLTYDLVEKSYGVVSSQCRVFNMYGPTEATIISATLEIHRQEFEKFKGLTSIPIGKPTGNLGLLILDKYARLCPVNIVGELYIGGDGLSIGYLNNPELTAEKFCLRAGGTLFEKTAPPNPPRKNFLLNDTDTEPAPHSPYSTYSTYSTIYRTGDLARWHSDGYIEFLGRQDNQVKIRGFRIELGEIENRLLAHKQVKEAVVIARTGPGGDNYLCAYLVTGPGVLVSEVREYLSGVIPGYMVPSYFVIVEKIPLNPNGKVDRRSLPEPVLVSEGGVTAPRDAVEKKLVEIWSEVLGIDPLSSSIGIDDNFFEMGGHSLKATLLASKLNKVFKVGISLIEIFTKPSIRELSAFIKKEKREIHEENVIPIDPVEKKEYYRLSSMQARLYVLQGIEAGVGYNIPSVWVIGGEVSLPGFEEIFRGLIRRHESLRTSFHMVNDEPVQRIHEENYKLQFTNYKQIPNSKSQITKCHGRGEVSSPLIDSFIRDFIRPFDLSRAPLFRVGLIETDKQKKILMVDMHHIISDGASVNVLIKDFIAAFRGENLSPQKIQYKDFSAWQKHREQDEKIKHQGEYWLKQWEEEKPVLSLPTDYPRPLVQGFEGQTIPFELGERETCGLETLAREQDVTLFMVLLGVYTVLLAKLSGQEDIVVGTPIAGRNQAELENILGMFVNTLALRNFPYGEKSFSEFLAEVKERTLEAYANQEYPFEELVEKVVIKRDVSRNPLFDVMLALQNLDFAEIDIPGITLKPYPFESYIAKFDLTFICTEVGGCLHFTAEYGSKLFTKDTIERFITYFRGLVSGVIADRESRIGDLEIITEEEKQEILSKFNNFESKYEPPRTIPGLFREQVEQTPDCVALVGPKLQLSYGLLNEESHRLAYTLQEKGVKPGSLVGIIMERSVEMIIGILGILNAGSGYVPLNPKAPHTRNRYILDECRVNLLLTAGKLQGVPGWTGETIFTDRLETRTGEIELKSARPSDLAYVIFTSGSTGQPKGVPIRHDNFSPLLHWGYRHLGIGPGERAVQNLSYYFDWSVWEIFIALTRGATLYTVSEEMVLDAGAYIDFIEKHGITILHITPTQYGYLANTDRQTPTLRYLFIGAEKLTYDLVAKSYGVVSSQCRVFNMYGPTEATIISAALEIDRQEFERFKGMTGIPIGKPTANLELLILDKYNRLCPVNIVGELYIGGDGLSIGYLNNPELTTEKFIVPSATRNPFEKGFLDFPKLFIIHHSTTHHSPLTIYKTGDLARWVLGGYIEFLGRGDFQVKIRGFRIELGEIENRLLEYAYIKEAAVIDRRWENRETYLCAYLVPGEGFEAGGGVKALKEFLSGVLPDYMIPSAFVTMERMPLNPNKKIDRKALPEPTNLANLANLGTGREYIPPRDETERKLSLLWAKILNLTSTGGPGIGVHTDFFEIGGHSLKVLNLVNAIEKEFRVKVEFQDIFQYSTLGGQAELVRAELVRRGETARHREIRAQSEKEYYELSYTQRRLWLLNQLEPDSPAFNLGGRIVLEEEVKEGVIREVLAVLAERHESFRTYFKIIGGGPVQVLRPGVEIHLEKVDLTSYTPAEIEKQRQQLLAQESKIPFDLEKPPLLRMKLVKWGVGRYDLLFTMHHIISDGWSLEVLEREFLKLYESRKNGRECEMPVPRLRYKDYAVWHNRLLSDETGLEAAKVFWKGQLSGETVALRLPYDHPQADPDRANGKPGAGYRMVIPDTVTRELHVLAREHKASLFMVLLSGFIRLWNEISGQTDILLGIPGAGRPHEDLENIIGLFVNTLIVKSRVDPGETFHDLLDRVQKNLVQVLEYQDFPLELICKELKIKYPEIRVFFNMFTFGNSAKEYLSHRQPYHMEEVQEAKFDLECYLSEYRNGVQIDTHYAGRLFKPVTIEKIMHKYQDILESISLGRGDKSRKQKRKIKMKGRSQ